MAVIARQSKVHALELFRMLRFYKSCGASAVLPEGHCRTDKLTMTYPAIEFTAGLAMNETKGV